MEDLSRYYTLEHDPTLGLESVSSLVSTNLLLILIGAIGIIAVAVGAIKLRKKVVNIVAVQ